MTLLNLVDQYVFSGVPSNAAWDLTKATWEKLNQRSWEDLYLDAFEAALADERPRLQKYGDGEISLERETLRRTLHQDLGKVVSKMPLSNLTDKQFAEILATALTERQALIIGGHNLSQADYVQIISNLVRKAKALFKTWVVQNPEAFQRAMVDEALQNQALVRETQAYLEQRFELVLQRLDTHTALLQQILTHTDEIKTSLGLDRSQTELRTEIEQSIATQRPDMFMAGGLCSGYPLKPLLDRYFVAQEFSPDRDDLRQALTTALTDFEMQPIYADDFMWSGHILCKISALIQSTPFGVYQLSVSQNRNVYLELGIAMGLGRPFILVKERGANVSPLAQGLEYYSIDSYLELRYELGQKIKPFLADIANYRPPALPLSGGQQTVVIAHGNREVIDFCVPLAKSIAAQGLTPIILGDPTGKLSRYLELENVPHRLINGLSSGQTRLDEVVTAIQTARLGIYRIDPTGAADAFLGLGISIGLNRPGLLIHHNHDTPPSDLRGLSGVLTFTGYTDLDRTFPQRLDQLLNRYG